jgi:ATP-dependent helicase/nuclease subunit B
VSPDAADRADRRAVDAALADLAARGELTVPPQDWPATFEALIAGEVVRGPLTEDAVRILGPLEARLQAFDHAILGGLNEGTWPATADAGPWMSRGMMSAFGIDLPERRIGLAAHDFAIAASQPRVTLSRALKSGGEPQVASRWWQRLLAFAGEEAEPARARGARLVHLAGEMDRRPALPPPGRPCPAPPVEARPTSFSVTEVARLVRDPYAVYAKRVLGLKPLDPLEEEPGAGDRGDLVHRVLARFVGEGHHRANDAEGRFHAIVAEELRELSHAPDAQALWGARLAFIAPAVVAAEAERAPRAARSLTEVEAEATLPGGLVLKGRIDRIDIAPDGSAEVIDYKTGRTPSARQVKSFLEPQLPLEAALIRTGAVEGVPADAPLADLSYVRLAAGREAVEWVPRAGGEADDLASGALERFLALSALYADPAQGYLSRARLEFAGELDGDYDHLARAAEWQNEER